MFYVTRVDNGFSKYNYTYHYNIVAVCVVIEIYVILLGAVESKLDWQWFITKYNGNIVFRREEFGGLSLQRVVLSTRGVVRVHVTLFLFPSITII